MRFAFIAKHRGIWPASWICEALGVSRSGFHAWLSRAPSARARSDEALGVKALERENRELRQANEILRKASAYFAQAELDRRFKR